MALLRIEWNLALYRPEDGSQKTEVLLKIRLHCIYSKLVE
jgi:hypothetical protein